MKKLLVVISAISMAGIACAGTIATPYIAGEFQGWDPAATTMAETASGSDIWIYSITGLTANQRQEFKITDGSWGSTVPAANSWYLADNDGNITITYDGNTYADGWAPAVDRIGVSYDPSAWTVVGDFWTTIGGNDWENADLQGLMVDQGGGIYSLTINNVAVGAYQGRPVMTGSWDGIGADGRSVNASNLGFATTATDNDVVFSVNALTGVAKVEVIPEPATLGLIGLFGASLFIVRRKFQL